MNGQKNSLLLDMEGKVCGFWKVGRYSGGGKWLCVCACGTTKSIHGQTLRQSRSASCGCSWSRRSLADEFWKRLVRGKDDECWPWKNLQGERGQIMFKRKNLSASRVSWEVHFGKIPDGLHVLHTCDNPSCVNPGH